MRKYYFFSILLDGVNIKSDNYSDKIEVIEITIEEYNRQCNILEIKELNFYQPFIYF